MSMAGEKGTPQIKIPEYAVGERISVPALSDRTVESTLTIAKRAAEGHRPSKQDVESFVGDIAKDVAHEGAIVNNEAIQKATERLTNITPDEIGQTVELPSFDEIKKTLEYVERTYATPDVRKKIKAASASMMGLELVMGAGQYAWQ